MEAEWGHPYLETAIAVSDTVQTSTASYINFSRTLIQGQYDNFFFEDFKVHAVCLYRINILRL